MFNYINHLYRMTRRFVALAIHLYSEKSCQKNAASLTYVTLFAIVPMITVCYSMFSIIPAFKSVGDQFQSMIIAQLLPGNEQVISHYLSDFARQARKLTAFGVVFLMASAYFMLRNIEQNVNAIWSVPRERRGLPSFLLYWAILSLGPLLLGLALLMKTYLLALRALVGKYDGLSFMDVAFEWLPWLLMACAFTLLFVAVPNCKVRLKHAAMGGFATLLAFELLKSGFGFIVSHSNFKLIYGAFAVVPLFLLWVNLSWMVVLGGAVLVRSIELFQVNMKDRGYPDLFGCLLVLWQFHQASCKGQGVAHHSLLQLGLASDQWQRIRAILLTHNVIAATQQNEWVLCRDLSYVNLKELKDFLGVSQYMPANVSQLERLPWMAAARRHLGQLDELEQTHLSLSVASFFATTEACVAGVSNVEQA